MINSRAPEMWEHISEHVDFKGASVLDVGCGYGDLLTYAARAGASYVVGVDIDRYSLDVTRNKLKETGVAYKLQHMDINKKWDLFGFDVVICTSVLPYVDDMNKIAMRLAVAGKKAIIEMQYHGDGPGPLMIASDSDMEMWLHNYWRNVKAIGTSFTGRIPPVRSLWLCTNMES